MSRTASNYSRYLGQKTLMLRLQHPTRLASQHRSSNQWCSIHLSRCSTSLRKTRSSYVFHRVRYTTSPTNLQSIISERSSCSVSTVHRFCGCNRRPIPNSGLLASIIVICIQQQPSTVSSNRRFTRLTRALHPFQLSLRKCSSLRSDVILGNLLLTATLVGSGSSR